MKKNKARGAKPRQPSKAAPKSNRISSDAARKLSRRETLRQFRDWGILGTVVAAGGWWLVQDVRADMAEHDLSRIGAGAPVVVQVHDPQCPTCRALQREVRDALRGFEDGSIEYVIANIRTAEGRALAQAHGVGHVTLLLFDGDGNRLQTLSGMRQAPVLRAAFQRHVAASQGS